MKLFIYQAYGEIIFAQSSKSLSMIVYGENPTKKLLCHWIRRVHELESIVDKDANETTKMIRLFNSV
jgi:ribosomal protein L24E